MTISIGSKVRIINEKNVPLRGQPATVKNVGMIGTEVWYFRKAENGKTGKVLERHIEREDEAYEDRLMPLSELAELSDISMSVLQSACSRKALKHMREGNTCYSTLANVAEYKLRYYGDRTCNYAKEE